MSKSSLSLYGGLNLFVQKSRRDILTSQYLINLKTKENIFPKEKIIVNS